jgi:hypothetical protein
MHARFRRCLDEKVDRADDRDIVAYTNVTMGEFDATPAQPFKG